MTERTKSTENLGRSLIKQVTFVIPAYNESENIPDLVANLNAFTIPDGLKLRVVLSDNGSTDNTSEIAKQSIVKDHSIVISSDSTPRSIGSARKVGVEQAISTLRREHPTASSSEHIIVNFDADTRIPSPEFLSAIVDIFSDPNAMVAYGPLEWVSRDGSIEKRYKYIQHSLDTIRLRHLFRAYGRKLSHYTNGPQDIIPGACTIVRESVLLDAERNVALNFNQLDRVGEDVRFSLELQQRLHRSQIIKDDRLLIRTSARGLETASGRISRLRGAARLLSVLVVGDHVPATARVYRGEESLRRQRRIQAMRIEEPSENLFDVVSSFIYETDKRVYQLTNRQYVKEVIRLRENAWLQRRMRGEEVRPAISAVTGEVIPNYYAVIGSVD